MGILWPYVAWCCRLYLDNPSNYYRCKLSGSPLETSHRAISNENQIGYWFQSNWRLGNRTIIQLLVFDFPNWIGSFITFIHQNCVGQTFYGMFCKILPFQRCMKLGLFTYVLNELYQKAGLMGFLWPSTAILLLFRSTVTLMGVPFYFWNLDFLLFT